LWLTGIRIDAGGQQLALAGRTVQPDLLPDYMRRLSREAALQGRQFERLEVTRRALAMSDPTQPGPTFVEFTLQAGAASVPMTVVPPPPAPERKAN
jgi:hypothetical protein